MPTQVGIHDFGDAEKVVDADLRQHDVGRARLRHESRPLLLGAIEPLNSGHDRSSFSCGKPALDAWLRTQALRNQQTGDSRTFVASEHGRVVGFYALTTASAARVGLPGALRRNAPDPVPLLLLGQLAVTATHRGKGLGAGLLRDALIRTAAASRHVGFRALATHPIDAEAEAFYSRFGFTLVPGSQPRLMVLPLQRLFAALGTPET